MKRTLTLAAAACALLFATASAQAIVLDLNDFIALPYAKVSINGTGTEANIVEDQSTDTILSNNPYYGDPLLIDANLYSTLSFDYASFFYSLSSPFDTFRAFIVDADATGMNSIAIAGLDFTTQSTASGTVTFNLIGLGSTTLGLEFQLIGGLYDSENVSSVRVSNVQLLDPVTVVVDPGPTTNPVPEPGTMAIFGLGLAGLGYARRRKTVSAK